METIKDYTRRNGFRLTSERLAARTDGTSDNWDAGASHWRVTIHDKIGASMLVEYSMGSLNRGDPKLPDVLESLALDFGGFLNNRTFDEWCGEYGYDSNSRKAEHTYRAIEAQAAQFAAVFPHSPKESESYAPRYLAEEVAFVEGIGLLPGGMGNFLAPPNHPIHSWHIGTMNGEHSLDSLPDDLDTATQTRIADLIEAWQEEHPTPDPIWVRRVMAHFHDCYSGQNPKTLEISWNASDLRILPEADPMLNADIHAGVHYVRNYYPDYRPDPIDFAPPLCADCGHHVNAHTNGDGGKCAVILDMTAWNQSKAYTGGRGDSRYLCTCQTFRLDTDPHSAHERLI